MNGYNVVRSSVSDKVVVVRGTVTSAVVVIGIGESVVPLLVVAGVSSGASVESGAEDEDRIWESVVREDVEDVEVRLVGPSVVSIT